MEGTERSRADRERSHPHPIRSAIRDLLPAGGGRLPTEALAATLEQPEPRVSYHAGVLVDLGILTEPHPGVFGSPVF